MKSSEGAIVIGADPGLSACGVAAARLGAGNTVKFLATEIFRTERIERKRGIREVDGNAERLLEQYRGLLAFCAKYPPALIVTEAPTFPRSAVASAKLAMSWSCVVILAQQLGAATAMFLPQEVKTKLTGSRKSSKEEIQVALEAAYPGISALWPIGVKGGTAMQEHAADACAVIHAALTSQEIRLLRNR